MINRLLSWLTRGSYRQCVWCDRWFWKKSTWRIWLWWKPWWHAYEEYCSRGCADNELEAEEGWLCGCGNWIDDGLHCPNCGCEPPWGCPCDAHDEDDDEWEPDSFEYCEYFRSIGAIPESQNEDSVELKTNN
ncbi:hypothetical protein AMJ85_09895 [candidate division BRC1 bacterium SM23_51]|nr:MAG: hypothetical protein AMJ85_09895 [candidate division BRC1 bacterium SM23_51]